MDEHQTAKYSTFQNFGVLHSADLCSIIRFPETGLAEIYNMDQHGDKNRVYHFYAGNENFPHSHFMDQPNNAKIHFSFRGTPSLKLTGGHTEKGQNPKKETDKLHLPTINFQSLSLSVSGRVFLSKEFWIPSNCSA